MILAATRDAARLFLELGTVTVVLAVGARLAARTGFSSIPLYLIAGIVLGALAPPTLDDVLVTTLSEVGIYLLSALAMLLLPKQAIATYGEPSLEQATVES
jgi:Kef-type K+ transport system membrane component KefB